MLTFENILELFQEYLLRDPEEEVLPCKRGYVRLTWNKDSRYCVDGILCRTPEELFDEFLDSVYAAEGCGSIAQDGSQRLPS
mgnify:CR=1 FL=1